MHLSLSALASALLLATSTQAAVFQSKQVKQLNGGNFKRLVQKSEVSAHLSGARAGKDESRSAVDVDLPTGSAPSSDFGRN